MSGERELAEVMRPFTTGSDYVNQIALETDDGSERIKAAYGGERLVAVKNKYDPTNLFRHNQNIKRQSSDRDQGRPPKYAMISLLLAAARLLPSRRRQGAWLSSQLAALDFERCEVPMRLSFWVGYSGYGRTRLFFGIWFEAAQPRGCCAVHDQFAIGRFNSVRQFAGSGLD